MLKALQLLATLASVAIAGLGVFGLVAPTVLLEFGSSLLAPPALYGVAAVRVLFGALLIAVAAPSHTPMTLRVLGTFILVAGVLTPFFGNGRLGAFVSGLSERVELVRTFAVLALLLGLFLVYAINSNRRGVA